MAIDRTPPEAVNPNTESGYKSDHGGMRADDAARVTPIKLLGNYPEMIDCPFCELRAETLVKRPASGVTQYVAVRLLQDLGPLEGD
jgi:hypothetical protein